MPPKGRKRAAIPSLTERKVELLKRKANSTPDPEIAVKRFKSASPNPESGPRKKREKSDNPYGLVKLEGPPPPINYERLINQDALELFDGAQVRIRK